MLWGARSENLQRLVPSPAPRQLGRTIAADGTFLFAKGKRMFTKTLLGLSTALALISVAASADTEASAGTDLNVRSGPGPLYSIVGVIPANQKVMVQDCLADASWCEIVLGDVKGWSAGNYLTATVENAPVALSAQDKRVVLKTVTYDHKADTAAGGMAAGAIAGAMIAGPIGVVVGGIVGAASGAALAPDPTVITYVRANPTDEVYLDGEVVVGAGVPEGVKLVPVPDSKYTYAYINGVPVLVDPDKRSVVYIVR
jgi:uncharacterized protein YraI